uniref:ABC transporter permease n=1 Tax=Phenylobacterium sp. TaxID=1871053 RepID=UPI00301D815B
MSDAAVPLSAIRGRSLWDDALRRLLRNRAATASLAVLGVLVVAAVFGPMLSPYAYDQVDKAGVWLPPLAEGRIMGTDALGRDLLVRLLTGLRVSLAIGLVATLVSLVIGVAWGAVAGYVGGKVDEAMMRVVDVLYSLPFIFFVILLVVFFGRSFVLIFIAIGCTEWLDMARIVRGQTLSIKRQEYVQAAEALGVKSGGVLARHIIPNTL